MRFLKDLLRNFAYVTTGTVIAFAVYTAIIGVKEVPIIMVAEIPVAGLVTALIATAMLFKEQRTRKGTAAVTVLNYILVSAAMVALGLLFGWIEPQIKQILLMLACVVFVYVFTFVISYLTLKKEADEINEALKNKFSDNES